MDHAFLQSVHAFLLLDFTSADLKTVTLILQNERLINEMRMGRLCDVIYSKKRCPRSPMSDIYGQLTLLVPAIGHKLLFFL